MKGCLTVQKLGEPLIYINLLKEMHCLLEKNKSSSLCTKKHHVTCFRSMLLCISKSEKVGKVWKMQTKNPVFFKCPFISLQTTYLFIYFKYCIIGLQHIRKVGTVKHLLLCSALLKMIIIGFGTKDIEQRRNI